MQRRGGYCHACFVSLCPCHDSDIPLESVVCSLRLCCPHASFALFRQRANCWNVSSATLMRRSFLLLKLLPSTLLKRSVMEMSSWFMDGKPQSRNRMCHKLRSSLETPLSLFSCVKKSHLWITFSSNVAYFLFSARRWLTTSCARPSRRAGSSASSWWTAGRDWRAGRPWDAWSREASAAPTSLSQLSLTSFLRQ